MKEKARLWLAVGWLAGGVLAGPVAAQPVVALPASGHPLASAPGPSAADLTLRLAVEAAWQRAVAARSVEGQRNRAQAERAGADSVWAGPPTVEFSHRNDRLHRAVAQRETELGVALPLWLAGQRSARLNAADAAAAHAAAAAEVARLQLAGDVREAAWQLVAAQAESAQADAQVGVLKQLADDVERRVQAGDLARADALAAQAEHWAAAALQAEVRQRLRAAQARWTLLTGWREMPTVTVLTEAASMTEPLNPITSHPEWTLARQTVALARQRLELVRQSRRDAPELSVALRQDSPGRAEASQGSLLLGLRWPMGSEGRNRPLEAAALADLDLAEVQALRLRERLDSDAVAAQEAQRSAVAQLKAETERARLLRERATLIDQSFRAGESPLPDGLRALAAAAQADSAVARQTAVLGLARARLQQALGLLP